MPLTLSFEFKFVITNLPLSILHRFLVLIFVGLFAGGKMDL